MADVVLDFVIAILFCFEEQHCKWEVAVFITIEFIDCIDFVYNKHFKATEAIGASVELADQVLESCDIVLVKFDVPMQNMEVDVFVLARVMFWWLQKMRMSHPWIMFGKN